MLSDVDICEEYGDELGWPVWVICDSTFRLWRTGGHPPPEFRLRPAAAAEVACLKAWAKEHEEQEEEEAACPKPTPRQQHGKRPPSQLQLQPQQPPQPPQMPPVTVEALHPTQFDPAVLARVSPPSKRAHHPPVWCLQCSLWSCARNYIPKLPAKLRRVYHQFTRSYQRSYGRHFFCGSLNLTLLLRITRCRAPAAAPLAERSLRAAGITAESILAEGDGQVRRRPGRIDVGSSSKPLVLLRERPQSGR